MDIYSHALPSLQDDAMEKMGDVFKRQQEPFIKPSLPAFFRLLAVNGGAVVFSLLPNRDEKRVEVI